MKNNAPQNQQTGYNRLLIPVLTLSALCPWLITVAFQLFLLDIAEAFSVGVGTASMTASVGAISGIACGLLMAVVSVRINHKILLLAGLLCTTLAAVSVYFAPNFIVLAASNIGIGGGIAIVTAMAYALIGDFIPLQKRPRAIGLVVAAITLAYVVGGPIMGVISTFGDWRTVMLILCLPLTLATLVLGVLVIPKKAATGIHEVKEPFSVGCKQAFSNRSIIAALVFTMLILCGGAMTYYSVSFFRAQFDMPITWGSAFVLIGNIAGSAGGAAAGLLVNKVGRKRLGAIACISTGILTLAFTFMPTLELSGAVGILFYCFSSMTLTAGGSLVIEQLPRYRSTMSSLNAAFMNGGMLLSSLIAGYVLNVYGFQELGLVLGSFSILGAVVWIALVQEPDLSSG